MGNQRQIPVIQTSSGDLTLVQQNTNKVLRNIGDQADALELKVDQMDVVGEIKIANLTTDQFQSFAGEDWLLCNGQSCVNTTYSKLTGNNTVPTLTVGGVNTFIKVS